jgi:hypothetical protein
MAHLQALADKKLLQCGKAFMTSGNSAVRPRNAPFFDGVVMSIKTESQVFS